MRAANDQPYVPKTKGEVLDYLAMVMMQSPTFKDPYFTERNVESVFYGLMAGLDAIQSKLGREGHDLAVHLALEARQCFEADPRDETGESIRGRELILALEDVLQGRTSG